MSIRNETIRKLRWAAWHPHEKLWNWTLVEVLKSVLPHRRLVWLAIRTVIGVDTAILIMRALGRRLRQPRLLLPHRQHTPLLYIDCGTHREGLEVRWMHRWFAEKFRLRTIAFEASSTHYGYASAALADLPDVELLQAALIGPGAFHRVRLYRSPGEGRGDSLFSGRGSADHDYEDVTGRRLTRVLEELGISLGRQPVILRMNIEGAEKYVIEDLAEAGALRLVDGYYGMWDDLSKIDPSADEEFRHSLRDHRISPFTFNDRDLGWALRRFAIRFDIETAIRSALRHKV